MLAVYHSSNLISTSWKQLFTNMIAFREATLIYKIWPLYLFTITCAFPNIWNCALYPCLARAVLHWGVQCTRPQMTKSKQCLGSAVHSNPGQSSASAVLHCSSTVRIAVLEQSSDLDSMIQGTASALQLGLGYDLRFYFFSPPVPMHGGLLCIAFCLSVCLSVCH